ncbi:ATP-binding protein [Nocardioides lentus]|uniref:ATP-binding protein n=1 Tax=Nocardioides lentus TaxID=338077 RepID=UPI0031E1C95D
MSRAEVSSRARGSLAVPGALLLILATSWSAVALAPPGSPTAAWWPAAGIAIALTALAPRRVAVAVPVLTWVLVAVGAWLGGRSGDIAIAFGFANAAEAAVAGLLLRRAADRARGRHDDPTDGTDDTAPLARLEELWWLGLTAVIGAALGAGIVSLTLTLGGYGDGLQALRNVVVSHAAGTLVAVPAAVAVSRRRGPARGSQRALLETAAQVVLLGATMVVTLFVGPGGGLLALAPVPLLVWAALRLGTRTVIWEVVALAVTITVAARIGSGPFTGTADDPARAYLLGALVQSYVICAVLTALPLAVTMDQRRGLLQRLLTSERVLRRGFAESVVGLLELADDGDDLRIVDVNDVAVGMLADRRDGVLGRRLAEVFDLPAAEVRRTVAGGEPWRGEVSIAGRPGTRVGVAVSAGSLSRPGDHVSAQLVDLTPAHEATQLADRERELSRAVAESAACLILLVDMEGVLVAANPAAEAMLGWTEDELVGRFVWELLPADRQGAFRRAVADLPAHQLPPSSEADLLCRDGGRRRLLWSTDFARDPDGTPTMLVMTGIDVTDERRQRLLVSQLLEAAMTTAIIGADQDGRISFFNTGASRLLGRPAAEAVGTPFVDVLDPGERSRRFGEPVAGETPQEAFFRLTLDIEPGRPPVPEDLTWRHADGSTRTVSTTLSAVSDPDLGVGILCIGRDVTEQRQTQELLMAALEKERTAVERLQALDHAKNDFVSTVSHELRTPVTSIVGYAEMLRDGTVDEPRPDQAPFLAAIARNADRLIGLADDLLTLSGLESGTAELGRERVDLGGLLERGRDNLEPLMRGRDLTTSYRLPDGPVLVHGDPDHLDRVLVNLVSNAVKFTDDGGRVEVSLHAEDGEAVLTVRDTGIGIPEGEQARLFTKFFRSSTAQERAIQGTGLGLSIVHSIVAAHGGRILVRSAHLAGTTVAVRLPLQEAPSRPGQEGADAPASAVHAEAGERPGERALPAPPTTGRTADLRRG